MFCPNCGKSLPENTKFCSSCGSGISEHPRSDVKKPTHRTVPNNESAIPNKEEKAPIPTSYARQTSGLSKNLKLKFILPVIVAALAIYFLSNFGWNYKSLSEEQAEKIVKEYYLCVKNGEYDRLNTLFTKDSQLTNEDRMPLLQELRVSGMNVGNILTELNSAKYEIMYIPGSLEQKRKRASASFDVSVESNLHLFTSYFSEEAKKLEHMVTFYFCNEDGEWLIESISQY